MNIRKLRLMIESQLQADEIEDDIWEELFESYSLNESVELIDIALGTGIGVMGMPILGGIYLVAKNVLGLAADKMIDAMRHKAARLKREMGYEAYDAFKDALNSDGELLSLINDYKLALKAVDSIKGKRGKEFQQQRQHRKDLAAEVSDKINAILDEVTNSFDKKTKKNMDKYPDIYSSQRRKAGADIKR